MKVFETWNPIQFNNHVHLMKAMEKASVERELRQRLGVSHTISSDALSALLISKSRYIADLRGALDPFVFEIVESQGLKPSRRSFMYEAQFSGLGGMFSGGTEDWLSNIVARMAFGTEDFVCFGEDFRLVVVLSHSYDLRIGDLADEDYIDPEMLALSKRLENEGQMRSSIERRVAERRKQRSD